MKSDEFKQWVPLLQPAMQRMAERLLDSPQEAEDLVQDLFVELWQQRKQLSKVDNLQGYCVRMTQFKCIDRIRARRTAFQPIAGCENRIADNPSAEPSYEDCQYEQLKQRIAELPQDQQQLLQLRYWQGLSSRQIGDQMQLSEGNVRVRLNRIIVKLRGAMASTKHFDMKNKLKFLISLLLLMTSLSALGQHNPRQFQRHEVPFADTLLNNFKFSIAHTNNGWSFVEKNMLSLEYDRKMNKSFDLGAFVSFQEDIHYELDETGSTHHTITRDGEVLYDGPGIDMVWRPAFILGGSFNYHPLSKWLTENNKFDVYLNMRLGAKINPYRKFDDINVDAGVVDHYKLPAAYLFGELNLGMSYSFNSHWAVWGETGCRFQHGLWYVAGDRLIKGYYVWQTRLGVSYKF